MGERGEHGRRVRDRGVTLVELVVVVVVLGILGTIAVPSLLGARSRAHDSGARQTARLGVETAVSTMTEQGALLDVVAYAAAEPAYAWTTGPSTSLRQISIMAFNHSGNGFTAAVRSGSGRCVAARIFVNGPGTVTYAELDGSGICQADRMYWLPFGDPAPLTQSSDVTTGPDGHGYEVVSQFLTWTEAQTLAAGRQWNGWTGHAITIGSAAEDLYIGTIAANLPIWTAARYDAGSNTWRWESGPEAGVSFWGFASDPTGAPIGGAYVNTRAAPDPYRLSATAQCGIWWYSDRKLTTQGCSAAWLTIVEYEP